MYFVQSNIQHVSPASRGFALPLDPDGDIRPPDPLFCPPYQIPGYAPDYMDSN